MDSNLVVYSIVMKIDGYHGVCYEASKPIGGSWCDMMLKLSERSHYIGKEFTEFQNWKLSLIKMGAIFEAHLRYGCQTWFHSNTKAIKEKIEQLQKKALQIIAFSDFRAHSWPLFKKWKILKIKGIVGMQNCLLSHFFLKDGLSKSFEFFFQKCTNTHSTPTRSSMSEYLYMLRFRSSKYCMNSITNTCICSWNSLT